MTRVLVMLVLLLVLGLFAILLHLEEDTGEFVHLRYMNPRPETVMRNIEIRNLRPGALDEDQGQGKPQERRVRGLGANAAADATPKESPCHVSGSGVVICR